MAHLTNWLQVRSIDRVNKPRPEILNLHLQTINIYHFGDACQYVWVIWS